MKAMALRVSVPVLVGLTFLIARPTPGQPSKVGGPQYTKDGALVFPVGYRDWTFVTSGLGMTYGPAGTADAEGHPKFDNVFVEAGSYRSFLETGAWPDKSVLILEVRGSDSQVSINRGGHVQTQVLAVEAHVKDAARGGWAFYGFEPGAKQAKLIPKTANCYSCHEQHGAVDSTFVQFYPTLVDAAKRRGTFRGAGR